ncbi:MAG: DUF3473 domain-containing protein [Anaerolineales bacterium]
MPSVLLSIDYESWFALTRRFDQLPTSERRALDGGYALAALDPLLEQLAPAHASFYLVGELVDWFPELPQKIAAAGHEVGFHCQVHRPLTRLSDIQRDLAVSRGWRARYAVTGFRAPMVNTIEEVYPLLKSEGFTYSSSIYAPAGTLLNKNGICELPVSTLPLLRRPTRLRAPRNMTLPLVLGGEFPYGSSFTIGLFEKTVLKILEKELKRGLSPVIFLHPYEPVRPQHWPERLRRDLFAHPGLIPFTRSKSRFLKTLLANFPVSTLMEYFQTAE